jgi:hypothetical protein
VRNDVDFFYIRIGSQHFDQLFERVAGRVRALAIICVRRKTQFPARRPCKQNGNTWRLRIVNDLCKPVNGIIKPVVEAMHEDKRVSATGRLCRGGHGGGELLLVEIIRRMSDEIAIRITRKGRGPVDFATLSGVVRRN